MAMDINGLLGGGHRLLLPAQRGEAVAKVVEACGQVGQEGSRVGTGELAMDFNGLLSRGQRILPPAQGGEGNSKVIQPSGPLLLFPRLQPLQSGLAEPGYQLPQDQGAIRRGQLFS